MSDAQEPIDLDQAKLHLRVDGDVDDALITGLIVGAREFVEEYTGLILTARMITETSPRLGRSIVLRSWPVIGISEIRYFDAGNSEHVLDGSAWSMSLKRRPVKIVPTSCSGWGCYGWGSRLPIEIDVSAGYPTPYDVPASVKTAMLMLVANWYTNREADVTGRSANALELPTGVEQLLRGYRLLSV